MSGFEIIGVVLGGLPLVIKAAEDYKKGLEPLAKWRKYKFEFRRFVNDVDIEKQGFDALVERLLQYTDLSTEQKQMLLTGQYQDGWCHTEVDTALKRRLGDSYDACMFLLESMKGDLLKLQVMLSLKDGSVDWVKPGEDKWNYHRKRLSHSFSHKGPDTIESLGKNNQKLRGLLDVLDQKIAAGKTEQTTALSKDTTWAKIFECIRTQASSLHSALQNGWKCSCEVPHLAKLQLQERTTGEWSSSFTMAFASPEICKKVQFYQRKLLVSVKQVRAFKAQVPSRTQPVPEQESYLRKLRSNIEFSTNNHRLVVLNQPTDRSISDPVSQTFSSMRKNLKPSSSAIKSSMSSNKSILLNKNHHTVVPIPKIRKTVHVVDPESTDLGKPGLVTKFQHSPDDLLPEPVGIDSEIKDLCSALETSDPNTSCLGYLCSPDKKCHEFRSIKDNQTVSESSQLISLDQLLSHSTKARYELTRKQRYRLAVILAASLLQLQTTPWLTKNMNKKDIFLECHGREVITERPYICHLFSSIKHLSASPSTTPPEDITTTTRFAAKASLNQLGILLLELCFGRAIEDQSHIREEFLFNGKPHNQTDILTAREWISDVEFEAGLEFRNAIKSCFDFDVKPNWNDIKFTQSIHAGVVQPLKQILHNSGWADGS